ncbi:MAG: GTP 3',8-cyclase MoaA [Planctomycetota bacterium]
MQRDTQGRPLRNLRISVTDRCNLRCVYCMPEPDYLWLPKSDILRFEEICRLVEVFASLGVDKLRITGGEPLLRRNLPDLVSLIARVRSAEDPGRLLIRDLAMTTNGIFLAEQAQSLRQAGLDRLTVSLDTLVPERFEKITRRNGLGQVLEGIDAARVAGFRGTKLDTVVIRDSNDDELLDLLEFGGRSGAEVRFIEYMDVGGATRWSMRKVVTREEMLERIAAHHGRIDPLEERNSAPAERFRLPDGRVFGIIASTTAPFCGSCDRSRLTADGMWYLCLYATQGADLKSRLRAGATTEELRALIQATWTERSYRGAEERLREPQRRPLAEPRELRLDPHLEMHKRGG